MTAIREAGLALLVSLFGVLACESDPTAMRTSPDGYYPGIGNESGVATPKSPWVTTPYKAAALYGIWGAGDRDIWAVGYDNNIVHWNGMAWSTSLSGTSGELKAVWGSGPNDVWAVGEDILHWDGTSWGPVDTPNEYSYSSYVAGIWGSSANDVWAVGGGDSHPAFVLHWDGTAWTQTSVATNGAGLNAVWGSGPNDVWAVGGDDFGGVGVILHWDGQTWSKTLEGSSTFGLFGMWGVWGSGPTDVWAVGMQNIAHFDGTSWTVQNCTVEAAEYGIGANVSTCPRGFLAVGGTGVNDVWAVGNMLYGGDGFIEHWNGTTWTMSDIGSLNGVNAIWANSPNNVWAVGPLVLQGGVLLHYEP